MTSLDQLIVRSGEVGSRCAVRFPVLFAMLACVGFPAGRWSAEEKVIYRYLVSSSTIVGCKASRGSQMRKKNKIMKVTKEKKRLVSWTERELGE